MGNRNTVHVKKQKQKQKPISSLYTVHAKTTNDVNRLVKINVTSRGQFKDKGQFYNQLCEKLVVYALYHNKEKVGNIFDTIQQYFQQKCDGLQVQIKSIDDGFAGVYIMERKTLDHVGQREITDYKTWNITDKGLNIVVGINYKHKTISTQITCEYMNKLNTKIPLHCPIYYAMKEESQFNEKHLNHLNNFTHFINEYEEKSECKHKDSCKSFIRCENGADTLNDECHMKLYRHPPRSRNIKLSKNIHSLIISKSITDNQPIYTPNDNDIKKYLPKADWIKEPYSCDWINALIEEVVHNGYKTDLCLECVVGDECKHNDYSILKIVDEKMICNRHKMMGSPLNRGEMMALVLYTGGECNYDLCDSQRKGNYKKWKWFDYCLSKAIACLSMTETGTFAVYSGISNVKLDKKSVRRGYFVTYVSTSWRRDVATTFMGNTGMLIQIDKKYKDTSGVCGCDVSWISKFPDECEVLFARGWDASNGVFNCKILDDSNGMQTVSLK